MKQTKKFECLGGCKKLHLDMLLLGCDKCIKKTGIDLTKLSQEKKDKIIEILNK